MSHRHRHIFDAIFVCSIDDEDFVHDINAEIGEGKLNAVGIRAGTQSVVVVPIV
jgi:hypothetical protein